MFGTLWDYLENLYISNCAPVMRPDDLVHLACFSKLVRLNIDSLRGPVEARQLNHLGRLTNLQELRILFAGHGLEQNLLVRCDSCCIMHWCCAATLFCGQLIRLHRPLWRFCISQAACVVLRCMHDVKEACLSE